MFVPDLDVHQFWSLSFWKLDQEMQVSLSVILWKRDSAPSTFSASPCTPSPDHSPESRASAPIRVCSRGHSPSHPTHLQDRAPESGERVSTEQGRRSHQDASESSPGVRGRDLKPALTEAARCVGAPVPASGMFPAREALIQPDPALTSCLIWETGLRLESPFSPRPLATSQHWSQRQALGRL